MIGVDLVFIPEFQQRLGRGGAAFLQKAFQASEIQNRQPEHLAGLWAAKEAVAKAAETTPETWTDIVIQHNAAGQPSATLAGRQFAVSIAHHGDYAVAVAQRMDAA